MLNVTLPKDKLLIGALKINFMLGQMFSNVWQSLVVNIDATLDRAEKNPEDIPKKGFFADLFD